MFPFVSSLESVSGSTISISDSRLWLPFYGKGMLHAPGTDAKFLEFVYGLSREAVQMLKLLTWN